MGRKAIFMFAMLVAACSACVCLPATDAQKFQSSNWVYTVSVLGRQVSGVDVEYTVKVLGILKAGTAPATAIGQTTTIHTGTHSCQVFLTTGEYYVLGGGYFNGKRSVIDCNLRYRLGASCAVPPCPMGCSSWFDGCNIYRCSNGRSIGSTKKFCFTHQPSKCLTPEKPKPKCPSNCKTYFDGCNTCSCLPDGSIGACTEKFCKTKSKPKCLDSSCIFCILLIPPCPRACRDTCVIEPQTCTQCAQAICPPKDKRTYFCDPFSVWIDFEQSTCLRKRPVSSLCCNKSSCCGGTGNKARYCKANYCKYLPCGRMSAADSFTAAPR